MSPEITFEVETDADADPGRSLVVGTLAPGMAGLTAADYLASELETERIGHVSVDGYPSRAPFADGAPRPHTRIYDVTGSDLAVLVNELFVPVFAAGPFVDGLLEWTTAAGIEDLTLFSGIPYAHGPEEHAVHYVATGGYRERRLADADLAGLAGGMLEGVAGELLARGVEGSGPEVGALVTPIHPPGPDLEAALRFLGSMEPVHGMDVDTTRLEQLSAEARRRYEEMANQLEAMRDSEESMDSRNYSVDRAYM